MQHSLCAILYPEPTTAECKSHAARTARVYMYIYVVVRVDVRGA